MRPGARLSGGVLKMDKPSTPGERKCRQLGNQGRAERGPMLVAGLAERQGRELGRVEVADVNGTRHLTKS
jgi:hypothetical protein